MQRGLAHSSRRGEAGWHLLGTSTSGESEHFLRILKERLRLFDTIVILRFVLLKQRSTAAGSHLLNNCPASNDVGGLLNIFRFSM